MTIELQNALANRFIARTDVRAEQFSTGAYAPIRSPWTRADLEAHLTGTRTYGHYLVNTDDTCKLFAFDIDLEKTGLLPASRNDEGWQEYSDVPDLRAAWLVRSHIARPYMKMQFNLMAQMLSKSIQDNLGLDVAVAYSGCKGVHVYGLFDSPQSAGMAREGAQIVLDSLGCFVATRGTAFFKHTDSDPDTGYPNLSIELFPKQDSLDGKDLGNLMRLPLGRNLKNPDPTFFMNFVGPINELTPTDPLRAMSKGNNLWAD